MLSAVEKHSFHYGECPWICECKHETTDCNNLCPLAYSDMPWL